MAALLQAPRNYESYGVRPCHLLGSPTVIALGKLNRRSGSISCCGQSVLSCVFCLSISFSPVLEISGTFLHDTNLCMIRKASHTLADNPT